MKQLNHLFIKYIANQCTAEEINFLLGYFKDTGNEIILKKIIEQALEATDESDLSTPDLDHKVLTMYDKIQRQIFKENSEQRPRFSLTH
jgi:ATP-dependent RNA circularization protein (DNA/RNA ligase family)